MSKSQSSDSFELFDLKIEVRSDGRRPMVCNHPVGSYFHLSGENIKFPKGGTFPIYSLAALMPLLPAKQRYTHPHDWMSTDLDVACPDPNCGGVFRIIRVKKRKFFHHQTTLTPLKGTKISDPKKKSKKAQA
jgi:uncharacterized repeat protein (TIGR04076 family)